MKGIAIPAFILVCTGALLAAAPAAQAWGCKGHQTVALIAEAHLSPKAKTMVNKLLTQFPYTPNHTSGCDAQLPGMARVGGWADAVRIIRRNGDWHFVDIPRGTTDQSVIATLCSAPTGCVVRTLKEQFAVLKNKSAQPSKRSEALRYLIHFAGDVHQPLHATTNSDRGGNCVPLQYFGHKPHIHSGSAPGSYTPELHGIWDTEMVVDDMSGRDLQEYASDLDAQFQDQAAAWTQGGFQPERWAWESFQDAESVAYGQLPVTVPVEPNVAITSCTDNINIAQRMLDKHIVIGDPYRQAASPVIERRLAQAGVRLAMVLNAAAN